MTLQPRPPAFAPLPLAEAELDYQMIRPEIVLDFLWRARFWICGLALTATLIAAFWLSALAIPLYRARASVMMETAPPAGLEVTMFTSPFLGSSVEIVSQMEVLRSNDLLLQLAGAERLEDDPEFGAPAPGLFWQNPEPRDQAERDQQLVETLRNRLYLRNIPGSLVFELGIASEDPRKSLRLSNALARAYIAHQVESRQQGARDATAWLALRSAELRETLIHAELEATTLRAASSFRGIDALNLLEQQIKDLRERLVQGAGTAEDQGIIQESLSALETSHAAQTRDYIALQQLDREVEAQRELYQHFLSQLQQNAARAGLQSAGSVILSFATLPLQPVSPRYKLVLGLSLLLGGLAGAGIAWLRLASAHGLRTPAETEHFTGLPVLGTLPLLAEQGGRLWRSLPGPDPDAPEMAMIRNLRAGIELALPAGAHAPVILCTSALRGEGKTLTTNALASHLTGLGRRVLVINADVWTAQPPDATPLRLRPGDALALDQSLMHQAGLAGAQGSSHAPAQGPARIDASDIAGLRREDWSPGIFGLLIGFAQRNFDITLIDTPPVLLVRETLRMLPYCDFTLLLLEWQRTDRRHLAETLALIARGRNAAGENIGIVMNKIDRDAISRMGDEVSFAPLARA